MSTREKDSAKLSEGGDRWIDVFPARRAEAAVLRAGAHLGDSHVSDRSSTREPEMQMQMHDPQPLSALYGWMRVGIYDRTPICLDRSNNSGRL